MPITEPVPCGKPPVPKNTASSPKPHAQPLKSAPTEGGDILRTFWYQSEYALQGSPYDCEVTELWEALCQLQRDWRRDKGVYSVEVMLSIGEVIRRIEEVMEHDTQDVVLSP